MGARHSCCVIPVWGAFIVSISYVSFYKVAWRWQFYSGLFVGPFMFLLSLTGFVYLFIPQLDNLM
ncbi:PepSY domain-containing protein, partial [Pseudomonas syringae group genomosp. 7]|uniref:PepSY domain-containing protein n=1 Tax=Pseudomonas syringae group genomosp. 7 TaxID=251699 RepID=UPI00376F92AE